MKITDELCASFTAASAPLIAWLKANCHPHVTAIVDCESAELLEGLCTNIRPEPAPEIFPGTTDALAGLSVRGRGTTVTTTKKSSEPERVVLPGDFRDHFAGLAMQGFWAEMANPRYGTISEPPTIKHFDAIAKESYAMADAMLRARSHDPHSASEVDHG